MRALISAAALVLSALVVASAAAQPEHRVGPCAESETLAVNGVSCISLGARLYSRSPGEGWEAEGILGKIQRDQIADDAFPAPPVAPASRRVVWYADYSGVAYSHSPADLGGAQFNYIDITIDFPGDASIAHGDLIVFATSRSLIEHRDGDVRLSINGGQQRPMRIRARGDRAERSATWADMSSVFNIATRIGGALYLVD